MVSKIEAAERMAKMVERYNQEHGVLGWRDVVDALDAYRSASVPSDEDLGLVAYSTTGLTAQYEWNDLTDVQRRKWSEAAAAVREWVQRDGLTEEEREWLCRLAKDNERIGHTAITASILRKLGREPDPVWEWDGNCNWWQLVVSDEHWARVDLDEEGITSKVWLTHTQMRPNHVKSSDEWTVAEAKAWCEQQLREARQ